MQDEELGQRIQQDRHRDQHGESPERFAEQCPSFLTVEDNPQNVRLAPGARVGDSRPNAEKDSDCRLKDKSQAAGTLESLGKVFQKLAREEIEPAMLISVA